MAAVDGLPMFSLAGRVGIVTGAAGLLGRQHCRALASAGATVIATDLDVGDCAAVAADLRREGWSNVHGIAADITAVDSLLGLREATLALVDHIDVLVN